MWAAPGGGDIRPFDWSRTQTATAKQEMIWHKPNSGLSGLSCSAHSSCGFPTRPHECQESCFCTGQHSHGEGAPVEVADAVLGHAMEEGWLILLRCVVVVCQLDEEVALGTEHSQQQGAGQVGLSAGVSVGLCSCTKCCQQYHNVLHTRRTSKVAKCKQEYWVLRALADTVEVAVVSQRLSSAERHCAFCPARQYSMHTTGVCMLCESASKSFKGLSSPPQAPCPASDTAAPTSASDGPPSKRHSQEATM